MTYQRGLILLLSILSACAYAQNLQLIDSLRRTLPREETVARFNQLNDLAWEHRFAQPDSTLFYADIAIALGEKLNLSQGLARAINIKGIAHNYKGERVKAFDYYSKALEVATAQRDSIQIAHCNNNIGRLFYEQGILSRAYEHLTNARLIFKRINDSSGLAYTYQSLAGLYQSQRDNKKAEESFLQAYHIRLALGNSRDIMSALVYLGRHYLQSNQIDKSIYFLKRADSTGNVIQDQINLAEIKTYLAEGYLMKGDLAQAEKISKEGVDVILKKNTIRMMPQAYSTMGQILSRKNDLAGAKRYFTLSLQYADRIKDLNAKMEAYYFLWKISDQQKDRNSSVYNQNQYLILKDSIKDLDLTRQVERLQFEVDIERKERENELLKANEAKNESIIEQQRLQNIILAVIVASISILVLLQWRNSKKRRLIAEKLLVQNQEIQKQREEIGQQNDALSRRNHELSELNHEKDTLMSIVAHDLKSPLNRIESLTYLLETEKNLTEAQQQYISMIKDAMQSGLDLITDLLDVHMLEEHVTPSYSHFDISHFLLQKVEAFQSRAAAKKILLNIVRIESEEIYTDKEYLDRIFDNLVSNAIKFSSKNSIVDISAGKSNQDFWICVKDRGPGFSDSDRLLLFQKFKKLSARPTAGESSNGLGLAIVKILADRLKGKIELVSEQGKGSQFTIRFPQ